MSLRVLSVAYPFAPVGPDPVGGAEQVLARLDRALAEAGWPHWVLAAPGSRTCGRLLPAPAAPAGAELDEAAQAQVRRALKARVDGAVAEFAPDVVHLHGIDFEHYLPAPGPACLATLHLPLDWYGPTALAPNRPRTWFNAVSAHQALGPARPARLAAVIENGVDPPPPRRNPSARRAYALALGRICPEKGFHLALEAAHRADAPLLLAGEVFPYAEHRRHFEAEIAPRLDARRRWLGPVGGARKRRLLAGARCVLAPSLVAETASLVAREAAAAGTPVIAFPNGALAQTVEHGVTGFLVDGVDAMAEAIGWSERISRDACREVARTRFSAGAMAAGYLALYARLARAS